MPLDLSALNDAQREAVTAEPGIHLVIAGAGTGKTRTLTYRAAWLVERGLEGKKLLLLTFTNKAARSMAAQASGLLGGAGKDMVQGTFHSVASRLLREFGEHIGQPPTFSILDMEDQRSLVRSVVRERLGRLDHFFPSPGVLVNILSYSFNKGASLEDAMMAKAPQAVEHMAKVYAVAEGFEERKRDTNSVDFDDLLRLWRRLLDVPEVCRELGERYGEVLVDEYQDTNGVQGEIADLLAQANGGRLMVVGDDCQSIYAFRGAVYENILGFTARHPEAVLHRLEDNYRSTEEVLDLANIVIAHNTRQYQKTLRPARPTHGPRPVVQPLPNAHAEAAWVAQWVLSRHRQGLGAAAGGGGGRVRRIPGGQVPGPGDAPPGTGRTLRPCRRLLVGLLLPLRTGVAGRVVRQGFGGRAGGREAGAVHCPPGQGAGVGEGGRDAGERRLLPQPGRPAGEGRRGGGAPHLLCRRHPGQAGVGVHLHLAWQPMGRGRAGWGGGRPSEPVPGGGPGGS
ncbi:ATP-dependent helicase [bacterium]|nr:ATP-dependent helicase [bacterium]